MFRIQNNILRKKKRTEGLSNTLKFWGHFVEWGPIRMNIQNPGKFSKRTYSKTLRF